MSSPRLALRRLAPAVLLRACEVGQRVVWTRSRVLPPWWDAETSDPRNVKIGALAQVVPHRARLRIESPRKSGDRWLPCGLGSGGCAPFRVSPEGGMCGAATRSARNA